MFFIYPAFSCTYTFLSTLNKKEPKNDFDDRVSEQFPREKSARQEVYYLFSHTRRIEMAEGVMPDILDAWARFTGLMVFSFDFTSLDSALILS